MTRQNIRVAEEDAYGFPKSKGGGLLTDHSSEPTRRVLRLAVQVSLVKGEDMEECRSSESHQQLPPRTSAWSSGPPVPWRKGSSPALPVGTV
jgi:hypothetical protein